MKDDKPKTLGDVMADIARTHIDLQRSGVQMCRNCGAMFPVVSPTCLLCGKSVKKGAK